MWTLCKNGTDKISSFCIRVRISSKLRCRLVEFQYSPIFLKSKDFLKSLKIPTKHWKKKYKILFFNIHFLIIHLNLVIIPKFVESKLTSRPSINRHKTWQLVWALFLFLILISYLFLFHAIRESISICAIHASKICVSLTRVELLFSIICHTYG